MNLLSVSLLLSLVLLTSGAPQQRRVARSRSYGAASSEESIQPSFPYNPLNYVRTKQDERLQGEDGAYTFDFETENKITMSEAGQSKGSGESIVKAGSYSFPLPDGNVFELKYVADENGFQPESSYLPVAPVFPHPIPQFVLDQIEKAAREDALRSTEDTGAYYQ